MEFHQRPRERPVRKEVKSSANEVRGSPILGGSSNPETPPGRDLNRDGFNTDLVPGTTRSSGSRDLNLAAVNAWRAQNGLAPISESVIDTSRINIMDARVSKAFTFGARKLEVLAQAFNLFNTKNLQAQFGSGRVGNSLSPVFGTIVSARPNLQGELALRVTW